MVDSEDYSIVAAECVCVCCRGGGVRLSTVVSCLCAGVKLLYPERGEEAREGLVALDSIHSTLWDHSEFRDILFSTSDSHQTLAAKGSVASFSVCCMRDVL